MTVSVTSAFNAARLAGALAFLDDGTAVARIRIYGGTRPASAAAEPTSAMLAEIALTKPAGTLAAGTLTLTQAEDGMVVNTGIATWARVVNGAAATAFDLDCSLPGAGGEVELAQTQLYLGGAARLVSCVLG
ncbi:MAG: hypothetical protein ACK40S_10965 [Burkholderiaceae bacterium]